MKKLTYLLLALLFSNVALAQGGPGPSTGPFVQNGATISTRDPTACLVFPITVPGGCKGPGTVNVEGLYLNGSTFASVGTVTSVGISMPLFGFTPSTITSAGTFNGSLNNQNANVVLAGPASGGAAAPTMRALVPADFAAITSKTLLANITGGSAAPTASTLTAYLDAVFGTAQGSILYRNSTIWTTLGPGTSGTFLKTLGAAANPIWDTPAGSGTINSSTANNLAVYSASTALSGLATCNNGLIATNGSGVPACGTAIPSGVTATTQSANDNSTKVATTAYTDAAVAANAGVPSGSIVATAALAAPAGWQLCSGGAVSRTTFAALFNAITTTSTITVTIASPAVVSWSGHGLPIGSPVYFTTTGALPTGITAGTKYFVISAGYGANAFEISTSLGGSAVNTTGTQSGTQTARYVPYGNGDGSTTFNVPDLRGSAPFGADAMGGTAASRLGNGSTGGITTAAIPGTNGGQQAHILTATEQASMSVSVTGNASLPTGSGGGGGTGVDNSSAAIGNANLSVTASGTATGGGGAHNITPPALVMNYIIKN